MPSVHFGTAVSVVDRLDADALPLMTRRHDLDLATQTRTFNTWCSYMNINRTKPNFLTSRVISDKAYVFGIVFGFVFGFVFDSVLSSVLSSVFGLVFGLVFGSVFRLVRLGGPATRRARTSKTPSS